MFCCRKRKIEQRLKVKKRRYPKNRRVTDCKKPSTTRILPPSTERKGGLPYSFRRDHLIWNKKGEDTRPGIKGSKKSSNPLSIWKKERGCLAVGSTGENYLWGVRVKGTKNAGHQPKGVGPAKGTAGRRRKGGKVADPGKEGSTRDRTGLWYVPKEGNRINSGGGGKTSPLEENPRGEKEK